MASSKDTILSIKADVYETSPAGSPTTWSSKASSVLVSICFDSTRNLCRVISVVGQTAIINSCITRTSHFIESSHLFGTWYDERNDTTFGVGFVNAADLKVFANAFELAKKKMEELTPSSAASNVGNSITEDNSTGNQSLNQLPASQDKNQSSSTSANNSNLHPFLAPEWHDIMTGTSRNGNLTFNANEMLVNNNSEVNSNESCNQYPLLPNLDLQLPNPTFAIKNENDFVVMNINTKLSHSEITTIAQENMFLRKALTDASKNVTDWQLELDAQRKLCDSLAKAKEDAFRSLEDWKNKAYENQVEVKIWKDRCEKSEATSQELSEEAISKYKQQYKDAVSGREYYKSVLQDKEMEIRSLKEKLEMKEASPSHTAITYKRENEALKAMHIRTKQQENISTHVANEQWVIMRDAESRMAEGIQRLIDVHTELKRSVRKSANWDTEQRNSPQPQ